MRYNDGITIDPGVGFIGAHVFRANSIFDPDFTGVGHQPMGHDTWATLYEHYTVVGAKITCTFYSTTTGAGTGNANAGVAIRDESAVEVNPQVAIENGRMAYRPIGTQDGSRAITKITKKWSRKKWFKGPRVMPQGAFFGNNPTEVAYFHINIMPAISSQNIAPIYVSVVVDYICLMTQPQKLALS